MSARGFSLVELLLVLAIAGIVAAVAAPRYTRSLARYRVDAAAARIAADLALARSSARTASTTRAVAFDVPKNLYQLPGVRNLRDGTTGYSLSLSDDPYNAVLVSCDFGGDATVNFDRFGRPDTGGAVVVQVGDMLRTVTLDASSGRAKVQ